MVARINEPAPIFSGHSQRNENFAFGTLAGRPVALTFFGTTFDARGKKVVEDLMTWGERLSTDHCVLCGVSFDPRDRELNRFSERKALIFFHDEDLKVGKLYGVIGEDAQPGGNFGMMPATFLIDERLRLVKVIPLRDPADHVAQIMREIDALPRPPANPGRLRHWAPVLSVPRIFEPEFCRELIDYYESRGGTPSGFMREREGRTFGVLDNKFKRRKDTMIEDKGLRARGRKRLLQRLSPMIKQAFMFDVTHIERDIVACYDAEPGGFFKAHRDNTTRGTAHRRFAVTINLNAEEFEGGELRFPEFGKATYRAETGGAVVFSCSLMHEALPVTSGKRYCYLPFLYDETGAKIRKENQRFLDARVMGADEKTVLYDPAVEKAKKAAEKAEADRAEAEEAEPQET